MAVHGFHHIGLRVKDMEKSLGFYTEGLGGKVTLSFPSGSGAMIYLVDLGGHAVVELLPGGTREAEAAPRWVHIALASDDVQADYDRAVAAGAKGKGDGPATKMLGGKEISNVFVYGPDNEEIEYFQER